MKYRDSDGTVMITCDLCGQPGSDCSRGMRTIYLCEAHEERFQALNRQGLSDRAAWFQIDKEVPRQDL